MAMGDYEFNLSLWVNHPDADLSGIPVRLGMPALRVWKKGDTRIARNGRLLGGLYNESYCSIQFERGEVHLPSGLVAAIQILRPHKEYLHELFDSGATISFFVGWHSDFNSRDVLDWQILRDLADLKISLDLDFYGSDPIEISEPPEPPLLS